MRYLLALAVLLAGCSADPVAPETVTVTDTVTVSPALEVLTVRGYRTTLPDTRYCVYIHPIPVADTTRRIWQCRFVVASDSLFVR